MIRIGSTSGMRGMFAYMYDSETGESINTGLTCKNHKQVRSYAIEWAKSEFGDDWQDHCDFKEEI